jgi:homoserine kinase
MTQKRVRVYAPASISNLGSGFDVLGVAIDKPGDFVSAHRTKGRGLKFSVRSQHAEVPTNANENVAAHVASLMLKEFSLPFGIEMVLEKKMPVGSGLGSSAASGVAAAVAVNALLPKPLKKIDLLRFAVEGERKASGSPHADNAAPSLLGGVCLIRSYEPLDVVTLPIKNSIVWVVVHPHLTVRTEEARRILPEAISLRSAIRQWGNVSGLTAGLIQGDVELVGKCVEDVIIEPVRAKLIPAFHKVKQAALDAGAAGCTISGSGPSLFAVTGSRRSAAKIASSMVLMFKRFANVKCDTFISKVNMQGAKVFAGK